MTLHGSRIGRVIGGSQAIRYSNFYYARMSVRDNLYVRVRLTDLIGETNHKKSVLLPSNLVICTHVITVTYM